MQFVYSQRSPRVWKLCRWYHSFCLWGKFWRNTWWIRQTYGQDFWMVFRKLSWIQCKETSPLISPFVDKAIYIGNFTIRSSYAEDLLGVTNDSNLIFSEHMTHLRATANHRLHSLSRVSKYISLKKRRILMKSFIIPQFNYCPLIWMTHSKGHNNKINHIHERALRIVYKDFSTPFEGLLAKDKSATIHNQNL